MNWNSAAMRITNIKFQITGGITMKNGKEENNDYGIHASRLGLAGMV